MKSGLINRGYIKEIKKAGDSNASVETGAVTRDVNEGHSHGMSDNGDSSVVREIPEISYRKAVSLCANNSEDVFLSVDISIDGPAHSGLATTEFVKSILKKFPILGPTICTIKEFFRSRVSYQYLLWTL